MSKEMVIGSNRHETKVAILEDDQLVEIFFQREKEYSLAGSIHKGRVTRVLPGMQSAFVDLGLERDTFLYVSDFFEENEDFESFGEDKPSRERRDEPREARPFIIASATPEPAEAAEEEPGIPAAEFKPTLSAEAPAGKPPESAPSDRRFPSERLGRRSRRRRQRGRGFPENKYAPPASAPSPREAALVAPREEEQPEKDSGVIILPGESLAKYRQAAAVPERSQEPEQETEASLPEEEALEVEADEIELAEKVLAHHDDESVQEVEEKIEDVREDQPIPPAEENEAAPLPEPEVDAPPVDEIPEAEATDVEDFEGADIDDIPESEAEPLAEESSEPNVPESTSSRDASEGQSTRTANVREQGGQYLQRSSRRMRRRRGGNRFPPQGQDFGSSRPTATGVATAAAMSPEPRIETVAPAREERSTEKPERVLPSISDLLKAGQEIIVQVAKEPLGQKGARITSHIALPGRYVVFMPSISHLGVSRKVATEEERQRLKRILQTHRVGTTGGFIVRTAGEGVPEEEIAADMNFLYNLWLDIRQKAEKKPAPVLLHYDLDIVQRILRDQVTDEFKAIWVDNEELYENTLNFMQRFQPALVNRVKMYTRSAPIFDAFNITQELEKALRPKVWLKSGGYIVINQTEALVAIDINTGKYVGKSNRLEDTIVKTNTEAVKEIVRQIRLRDLGGIIVVDFIDMDERKNRQKVMQALEEAMRADKAPYKILQFNDFGLVAITRKRVKQSLERTLCSPCPYCDGAGYVKSIQTIIGEILAEAQKIARAIDSKDVVLRVHPEVARVLKAGSNKYLDELEEILGRPVLVKSDIALHHEKFDLA
ncbi:MAG: Rne/Rng family ribonuclease [Bryobacteraceae bacterium]